MRLMSLGAVVALAILAACQEPPRTDESRYIRDEPFEDLPAPKDSVYRDRQRESFSYSSESFRCGKFLYDYEATPEETVAFFKQTMTKPPYGWKIEDERWRPDDGIANLTLLKNSDRCTIEVRRVKVARDARPKVAIEVRVNYTR